MSTAFNADSNCVQQVTDAMTVDNDTYQFDFLTRLPIELFMHLLEFLEIKDIGRLSLVCTKFNSTLRQENTSFWRKECLKWWDSKSDIVSAFNLDEIHSDAMQVANTPIPWKWFAAAFSRQFSKPTGNLSVRLVFISQSLDADKLSGSGWILFDGACDMGEFQNGFIKWGVRLHLRGKFRGQRYIGSFW